MNLRLFHSCWAAVLATVLAAAPAGAVPHYVTTNGTHNSPFLTWGDAATNIQAAVDVAAAGETVFVSNGVYAGGGDANNVVTISNSITLHGEGFDKVTISGGGTRRVLLLAATGAVVEGFTFFNGYNTGSQGGGAYVGAGTVRGCAVVSNKTFGNANVSCYGGGIYMTNGTVEDCLVLTNWAYASSTYGGIGYGGGIYMTGGSVRRCRVIANKTDSSYSLLNGRGGGIYMTGGTSENCLVFNNSGPGQGGGMHVNGAASRALHCTVVSNSTWDLGGGGLYLSGGAVSNSIVYYNRRLIDGQHNNVVQTGGSMDYSCSLPLNAGTGNVAGDPGFVDIASTNGSLLPGSPCIDTATTLAGITNDIDNTPRSVDGNSDEVAAPDMGAWEAPLLTGGAFRCNFTTAVEKATNSLSAVLIAQVGGPSTNGLYYWWDYQNDGTNDTEGAECRIVTNPYGPGVYSVRLTVSNNAPQVTTQTKVDYLWIVPSTAYVASAGGNVYPYDTWSKAATTVVAAINAAADPGTVLITNGTYPWGGTPCVQGAQTVRGMNGATATVVTGNYRVLINHSNAVMEGLSVFAGKGIYLLNGTVRDCRIASNYNFGAEDAVSYGGGVRMAAGLVENCCIWSNMTFGNANGWCYGGGIYMTGGRAEDCLVLTNWAYASPTYGGVGCGGGIYMTGGSVRRCRVIGNKTDSSYSLQEGRGGGICMTGGTSENCLVFNNSGPGQGGGMSVSGAGSRALHCTVASNSTWNTGGGGLYLASGAASNSIIYHNRRLIDGQHNNVVQTGGSVDYSCSLPLNAGTGNVDGDPGFVDIASNNCNLLPGSPCIDTAATLAGITNDIDKTPRPVDGNNDEVAAPDMGAWEAPSLTGGVFQCNFTTAVVRATNTLTAVLIAQVGGPSTNGLYYWWDYQNDGTNDAEGFGYQVVTNTYGPGMYSVRLTVSNSALQVTAQTKVDYLWIVPSTTYVASAGGNVYPYDTWSKAATTVVAAINAAADPGTVLITNGTYEWGGPPSVQGAQTVRGMNGATATVVTGNYRVSINHSNAVMERLSVFAGKGIYLLNGTVRDCHIASNYNFGAEDAVSYGGGVRMAAGVLENCRLWRNRVYSTANGTCYGGGLYIVGGLARTCLIVGNMATVNTGYGGGGYGGGVYVSGNGMVVNCTVSGNAVNDATGKGGGIYVNNGAVTNTIVWKNCSSGESDNFTESAPRNDFDGAYTSKVTYSCGRELTEGTGNITNDPAFVDAGVNYGTNLVLGDYRWAKSSPCRDAGFTMPWMDTALDLDGHPRIQYRIVDMGVYEAVPLSQGIVVLLY